MTFRATLILISGCAAALIVSSALAAQDTASTRVTAKRVTSETRVRVQKGESNGTLDVRADSIAASRARADSAERELATMRQRDSVEAVTRALAARPVWRPALKAQRKVVGRRGPRATNDRLSSGPQLHPEVEPQPSQT